MPLRLDEIKEVQQIAMIATKTASDVIFSTLLKKIGAIEERIAAMEKQSKTQKGKEK